MTPEREADARVLLAWARGLGSPDDDDDEQADEGVCRPVLEEGAGREPQKQTPNTNTIGGEHGR